MKGEATKKLAESAPEYDVSEKSEPATKFDDQPVKS